MAAVYRGENKLTRSIVRAIKVVRTELVEQPEFVERFAREAEVLERLRHPNIVAFFGLRESELLGTRVLFMELEFLDGLSLAAAKAEHAQRAGASVAWAVSCVARAADGVAAAHDLGIVHRDLKPDNIFLCRNGDVKVLDFGIAKVIGEMDQGTRLTTVGTIAGTVAYLAPEVCNGAPASARADVYALGVTLIELLLGHHPYEAPGASRKSTTQLMMAHVSQAMPSVRAVRSDVSPKLEAILARATAKDPAARFDSARDLSHALRELVPDLESALKTAPKGKLETEFAIPTLRNAVTTETGRTMDVPTGPAAIAASRRRRLWAALLVGTLALGSVVALAAAGVFGDSTTDAADTAVVTTVDADAGTVEESASLPNPWIRVDGARSRTVLGVGDDPRGAVGFRADRGVVAPSGAFEIQQHEVTWSELEPFLATPEATQHRFDPPSTVPDSPAERANLPAVGAPWNTARAYCVALGGSLPTEEQWEYAGRGSELRPYPWGNSPVDRMRTNVYAGDRGVPLAVMQSDQDVTPTGIYDLLGNAREWTVDLYRDDAAGQDESWVAQGDTSYRAVRGLSYAAPASTQVPSIGLAVRDALCATGGCVEAAQAELRHIGFRCARAVR